MDEKVYSFVFFSHLFLLIIYLDEYTLAGFAVCSSFNRSLHENEFILMYYLGCLIYGEKVCMMFSYCARIKDFFVLNMDTDLRWLHWCVTYIHTLKMKSFPMQQQQWQSDGVICWSYIFLVRLLQKNQKKKCFGLKWRVTLSIWLMPLLTNSSLTIRLFSLCSMHRVGLFDLY